MTIIENGAAAKIKSFINDEIGMLSLFPGWKDCSNQSIVNSMKPVYFHVDQGSQQNFEIDPIVRIFEIKCDN